MSRYDYGYRGRPRTCLWCGRPLKGNYQSTPESQAADRALQEEYSRRKEAIWKEFHGEYWQEEYQKKKSALESWERSQKIKIRKERMELINYGIYDCFDSQWCGVLFGWKAHQLGFRLRPLEDKEEIDESGKTDPS